MKTLGQRVRALRKTRKLSQEAVCKIAGISQPSLSAIERGETAPDEIKAVTLMGLATALSIDPEFLLLGKGDPLQFQLLQLYRKLSPDGRDALLGNANRLYSKEHPNDGVADPFGDGHVTDQRTSGTPTKRHAAGENKSA